MNIKLIVVCTVIAALDTGNTMVSFGLENNKDEKEPILTDGEIHINISKDQYTPGCFEVGKLYCIEISPIESVSYPDSEPKIESELNVETPPEPNMDVADPQ